MSSSHLVKLIETLLKKSYEKKPKKLAKYNNKVKKIRKKKKNKRNALNSQFKYANQLLQHNQKKHGLHQVNVYNKRRQQALKRLPKPRVKKMYNNTKMNGSPQENFKQIYRNLEELDWQDKQQQEYKYYQNKHNEDNEKKNYE